MKLLKLLMLFTVLLCSLIVMVNAGSVAPQGNLTGMGFYTIYNFTNISATTFWVTNGSELITGAVNVSLNNRIDNLNTTTASNFTRYSFTTTIQGWFSTINTTISNLESAVVSWFSDVNSTVQVVNASVINLNDTIILNFTRVDADIANVDNRVNNLNDTTILNFSRVDSDITNTNTRITTLNSTTVSDNQTTNLRIDNLNTTTSSSDSALGTRITTVNNTAYTIVNATYSSMVDQGVNITSAVTFATVDTGQGATEVYLMNQSILTDSDLKLNELTLTDTGATTFELKYDDAYTSQYLRNYQGDVYWYHAVQSSSPNTIIRAGGDWEHSGNLSTGGYFGVGTNTPLNPIDIDSGVATPGTSTTYHQRLRNGATEYMTLGGDASYAYIQSWAGLPLYLNSQGNNIYTGSGNVGIGTDNPKSAFHVIGTATFNTTINQAIDINEVEGGGETRVTFHDTANADQWSLIKSANDDLFWYNWNEGAALLHFDEADNYIGIVQTNPAAQLDVLQAASDEGLIVTGSSDSASSIAAKFTHTGKGANTNYAQFAKGGASSQQTGLFYRNLASANTGEPVVSIKQDNAGDDQNTLSIQNDGAGKGVDIDQNGDNYGIEIDSEATTGSNYGLFVTTGQGADSAKFASNSNTGTWIARDHASGTARNWFYGNDASATTTAPLVFIEQDNSGDDQPALSIQNDGTGKGVDIDQNGNNYGLYIDNAGTIGGLYSLSTGTGYSAFFDKNINDGSAGVYIRTQTGSGDATTIQNDGTGRSLFIDANDGAALDIDSEGNYDVVTVNNAGTKRSMTITQAGILAASEKGFQIYSDAAQTTGFGLHSIYMDSASSTIPASIITNDGSGVALELAGGGNLSITGVDAIHFSSDGTNHRIYDDATCTVITGDTSTLTIC